MPSPRADPVPTARILVATLPALIDQAEAARGPLTSAVQGLRTALAEARRVIDEADRPGPITSASELMRRLGG